MYTRENSLSGGIHRETHRRNSSSRTSVYNRYNMIGSLFRTGISFGQNSERLCAQYLCTCGISRGKKRTSFRRHRDRSIDTARSRRSKGQRRICFVIFIIFFHGLYARSVFRYCIVLFFPSPNGQSVK